MPEKDKTKATIMVNTELWKRLRVIAILNEFEISELVEEALREKLAKMQQPEQYAEYKDVKDLRYKPQTQTQSQPQPQLQRSKPDMISRFYEDLGHDFTLELPGIKFPANKNEIIECAKKAQYLLEIPEEMRNPEYAVKINDVVKINEQLQENRKQNAIHITEQLPNKKYANKSELEKDCTNIYKNRKTLGLTLDEKYKGRIAVLIDDREIVEPRQRQEREREQKQKGKDKVVSRH